MERDLLKAGYERYEAYGQWIQTQNLSDDTVRSYTCRVNHYLVFLATSGRDYIQALTDAYRRDEAVSDYQVYMRQSLKATANSVASAMLAIDHFYEFLGIGRSSVAAPSTAALELKALSLDSQEKFIRAIHRIESVRDKALASLIFYTGLSALECAQMDVYDFALAPHDWRIKVNGERQRTVVLNVQARVALNAYLQWRADTFGDCKEKALFLDLQGMRLSGASVDLAVRRIGREAGIELTAEVLAHTACTNLIRGTALTKL